MNKRDWIVLSIIENLGYMNQREIGYKSGYSLGAVNASLKKLIEEGYLDENHSITEKTRAYLLENRPKCAVILAAGPGIRMIPINKIPKGLLQVNGEPLIERIIRQLHKVNVCDITIVVGYMMERFEYLTTKFGVDLLVNNDFTTHDNLRSLRVAADKMPLENCYIVPSDIWFARNPFSLTEYHSWYAVASLIEDDSMVRVNRKLELIEINGNQGGNAMLGLCYLRSGAAAIVHENVLKLDKMHQHAKAIWEEALLVSGKMVPYAKIMLGQPYYSIKTYEQLRELDNESDNLSSRRINLIKSVFGIEDQDEITDISALAKGMTNRLMRFSVNEKDYLMRIPGEGSDKLTNRAHEAAVYDALKDKGITDKVVYISPDTGFKISEFWNDSRTCDPAVEEDVAVCMALLKKLHAMKLQVKHSFDIFKQLEYYQKLRGSESSYGDYDDVRGQVFALKALIDKIPKECCLSHIDAVSDNFLFTPNGVFLIDWEYAGMCDPHMDIAMFCIYAMYDKAHIDNTINIYFGEDPGDMIRMKIYCYISGAGLLWSLWCEYKQKMGVQYGQYALRQYQYAKRYQAHAMRLAALLGFVDESADKQPTEG
ncbi:MAG TPA: NTP transferase domain-containing protein [Clostridia bacterium]|nr:NTP transferase domain-containing protein [Clostridia bacterium]